MSSCLSPPPPNSLTGSGGSPRAGGFQRLPGSVLWVPLLERHTVTAWSVDGGMGNGPWDELILTGDDFAPMGPSIQDLIFHAELRNTTGGFQCRVLLQRKFLDGTWGTGGTPTNPDFVVGSLSSALTTDGYGPLSVYNDRTRLGGANIRLVLQFNAVPGGSGVIGAKSELTMGVALRLFCC